MTISRKSKWIIATSGFSSLVAIALWFWPFCFGYYSVCSRCGEIQDSTEWQLPHTSFAFWSRSSIEPTVMSRYLASSGLVSTHSHQWLFGHGGGNGVRCALGSGDRVRPTLDSPEVPTFLELTRQYGEPGETAKYLTYTFDRNVSHQVLILAGTVPKEGIHSSEEFRRWMNDWSSFIGDEIASANKRR
jgi:hypothetical protein